MAQSFLYEAGVWEQVNETADNPSGFVAWSRHTTEASAVRAARRYARQAAERGPGHGGPLSWSGGYRRASTDQVTWVQAGGRGR